jgi:hypothetical protein
MPLSAFNPNSPLTTGRFAVLEKSVHFIAGGHPKKFLVKRDGSDEWSALIVCGIHLNVRYPSQS